MIESKQAVFFIIASRTREVGENRWAQSPSPLKVENIAANLQLLWCPLLFNRAAVTGGRVQMVRWGFVWAKWMDLKMINILSFLLVCSHIWAYRTPVGSIIFILFVRSLLDIIATYWFYFRWFRAVDLSFGVIWRQHSATKGLIFNLLLLTVMVDSGKRWKAFIENKIKYTSCFKESEKPAPR